MSVPPLGVLDSSAALAYIRREPGANEVRRALRPAGRCHMHALNLIEVRYILTRDKDATYADAEIALLHAAGLVVHESIDTGILNAASDLKALYRRVSLADCVGLALAQRLGTEFLTTDHHELDALAAAGVAGIRFIR